MLREEAREVFWEVDYPVSPIIVKNNSNFIFFKIIKIVSN